MYATPFSVKAMFLGAAFELRALRGYPAIECQVRGTLLVNSVAATVAISPMLRFKNHQR